MPPVSTAASEAPELLSASSLRAESRRPIFGLRACVAGRGSAGRGHRVPLAWSGLVFWLASLVAWIIKAGVLRFGGGDAYRKLSLSMLGLILGEFSAAILWAILSTPAIGWSAPEFPWA